MSHLVSYFIRVFAVLILVIIGLYLTTNLVINCDNMISDLTGIEKQQSLIFPEFRNN